MAEITRYEQRRQKSIVKMIKNDYRTKQLSPEERKEYFDQIYSLYGSEVYRQVTPKNIQKQDKKDLLRSGRFLDIYEKYGEKEYSKHINYMESKDIANETNSKAKGIYSRIKNFLKEKIFSPIVAVTLALPVGVATIADTNKIDECNEYTQNQERIDEYLKGIEEYAQSVKKMNLTDTEVFMKVTDDMWKSIDGYKQPESELKYYKGINLVEDKIGVCRHMADDIARKLNAIDKDYNARVVTVYFEDNSDEYIISNIVRNVVEDEETSEVTEEVQENQDELNEFKKIFGNHAIVLLDVKQDDATLILDPTNPGIGILKDGKIIMFNANKENFKEDITFFGNLLYQNTSGELLGLSAQVLSSFRNTNLSMEELEKKYGLQAQNEALEYVREKGKSFKDTVRVELETGEKIEIDFSEQSKGRDDLSTKTIEER